MRFESLRAALLHLEVRARFNSTSTVSLADFERLSLCVHLSAKLLKLIGWFACGSDIVNSDSILVKFQSACPSVPYSGRGLNPCRPV